MICVIEGCGAPMIARGYCDKHYRRWKRHGSPLATTAKTQPGEAQRWLDRAVSYGGDDCLPWPFSRSATSGYGAFGDWKNATTISPHREVCRRAHGEPPSPQHQAAHDPRCTSKLCCNPKHLRWATPKENEADKRIAGTDCTRRNRNVRGQFYGPAIREKMN